MEADPVRHLSVADYLASQIGGGVRQEFIGNEAFPLDAGGAVHDRIRQCLFVSLQARLLSGAYHVRCADTLVRIDVGTETVFYYPDVVVADQLIGAPEPFLRQPKLIIEIFSRATEVTDCRGKKIFYVRVPSLDELVFVAEHRREVRVLRRASGWRNETFSSPDALVEFQSVRQVMTLAQIYEGVA